MLAVGSVLAGCTRATLVAESDPIQWRDHRGAGIGGEFAADQLIDIGEVRLANSGDEPVTLDRVRLQPHAGLPLPRVHGVFVLGPDRGVVAGEYSVRSHPRFWGPNAKLAAVHGAELLPAVALRLEAHNYDDYLIVFRLSRGSAEIALNDYVRVDYHTPDGRAYVAYFGYRYALCAPAVPDHACDAALGSPGRYDLGLQTPVEV